MEGSADDIFRRASDIIFDKMIPMFLENKPIVVPQSGEPTIFKRRRPEDGQILQSMDLNTIYDYIRMLDAEGYPNAFIDFGEWRLTFTNAELDGDEVTAKAKIRRKENE